MLVNVSKNDRLFSAKTAKVHSVQDLDTRQIAGWEYCQLKCLVSGRKKMNNINEVIDGGLYILHLLVIMCERHSCALASFGVGRLQSMHR